MAKRNRKKSSSEKSYIEAYARTHTAPEDFYYRLNYWKIGLIDFLLRDYSVLDVGCGTAGFFRHYTGAQNIVGIDPSKGMLEVARRFHQQGSLGTTRIEFVNSYFEDWNPAGQFFDCIRLGVYGSYKPLTPEILEKCYSMLSVGGILVVGSSWSRRLSAVLFTNNVILSNRRLKGLVKAANLPFVILSEATTSKTYSAFLEKAEPP